MSGKGNLGSTRSVAGSEEPNNDDVEAQSKRGSRQNEAAAPESEGSHPRSARRPPTEQELHSLAREIYQARQARDKEFDEPAWDLLLILYSLPRSGELSISSLSYAADIPQTTGLRWQRTLCRRGLVERRPDQFDARRQLIRLTPQGKAEVEEYLTREYLKLFRG